MRWHRIGDGLVEQTVRGAEWRESAAAGRVNAWMAVGERFLRVTYREEIDRIVVISAVFKRLPLLEGGRRVKIEYDPDADALYIQVREADVGDNIDIEDGVSVDVDADRHIVGLEILDASKRLTASDLSNIVIQRLPMEPPST